MTTETLISPVHNFGPVPVLFRLPVGSLASDEEYRHQFCSDCRLWSQKSSKGYRLNRITGYTELLVTHSRAIGTENYRLPSIAGSGVLLVTEICCSHPYWQGTSFKSSADSKFTGYRELLVTEDYRFRSAAGSRVCCWLVLACKPSGTVASQASER